MEKTLTVGERKIPLKLTADSLFVYKAAFSRDGFTDIYSESSRDIFAQTNLVLRFMWAFAKNCDRGTEPFEAWVTAHRLDDGEVLAQMLPEAADFLTQFQRSTVKSKTPPGGKRSASEHPTAETIIRRAIERGLTVADFGRFTLGMIIDYLVTCQNEDYDAKRNKGAARQATQADIDAF